MLRSAGDIIKFAKGIIPSNWNIWSHPKDYRYRPGVLNIELMATNASFDFEDENEVVGMAKGPYNRILGVIYLNGKNINLGIVKAGLGEVYRGRAPHKFPLIPYWQAEKEAKDDMKGMWSLGDKYVSPKAWRNPRD